MDIATIIGIIVGAGSIFGGIYVAATAAGANMMGFLSFSSFLIVFGGMIASLSVAFPMPDLAKLFGAISVVFRGGVIRHSQFVD